MPVTLGENYKVSVEEALKTFDHCEQRYYIRKALSQTSIKDLKEQALLFKQGKKTTVTVTQPFILYREKEADEQGNKQIRIISGNNRFAAIKQLWEEQPANFEFSDIPCQLLSDNWDIKDIYRHQIDTNDYTTQHTLNELINKIELLKADLIPQIIAETDKDEAQAKREANKRIRKLFNISPSRLHDFNKMSKLPEGLRDLTCLDVHGNNKMSIDTAVKFNDLYNKYEKLIQEEQNYPDIISWINYILKAALKEGDDRLTIRHVKKTEKHLLQGLTYDEVFPSNEDVAAEEASNNGATAEASTDSAQSPVHPKEQLKKTKDISEEQRIKNKNLFTKVHKERTANVGELETLSITTEDSRVLEALNKVNAQRVYFLFGLQDYLNSAEVMGMYNTLQPIVEPLIHEIKPLLERLENNDADLHSAYSKLLQPLYKAEQSLINAIKQVTDEVKDIENGDLVKTSTQAAEIEVVTATEVSVVEDDEEEEVSDDEFGVEVTDEDDGEETEAEDEVEVVEEDEGALVF